MFWHLTCSAFSKRKFSGNVGAPSEARPPGEGPEKNSKGSIMSRLFQDVRYALRNFLANPSFVVAAVLSLVLGIGINTSIFSVTQVGRTFERHRPKPGFSVTGFGKEFFAGESGKTARYRLRRSGRRASTPGQVAPRTDVPAELHLAADACGIHRP